MKKALALVLALVLALSLGVSAFALNLVELDKNEDTDSAPLIDLSDELGTYKDTVYRADAEGGVYYLRIEADGKELKDISVSATGIVSAEVVKYDPSKMEDVTTWHLTRNGEEISVNDNLVKDTYEKMIDERTLSQKYDYQKMVYSFYHVGDDGKVSTWERDLNDNEVAYLEANLKVDAYKGKSFEEIAEIVVNAMIANTGETNGNPSIVATVGQFKIVKSYVVDSETSYAFLSALADALNRDDRTNKYSVEANEDIYLVKLTIAPNYSAAYKTGTFKVTAKRVDGERKYTTVSYSGTVVSDVVIFEYTMVNWCGENDEPLSLVTDGGYSDYEINGVYGGKVYNYSDLRKWDDATVISTTAFRSLRESKNGIKVESKDLLVSIPEIVSGQKGVNFAAYDVRFCKANGTDATVGTTAYVEFGFYGDQEIASDFTVEVDLGVTAYELRDMFGEKVEEEDIITYYVVKDGKVVDSFTVDYMKDEIDEDLVLEIKNKAGSTLGQYEIVLEAPAADNKGEENPNTGAESVIGVVAAMAVVSVAAAAAVSLKK